MDIIIILLQLFSTFFLIGIFTFGGGYAMLSLIQTQVVVSHKWISESMFTDIVAISQMTPGPIGINTATYVGYEVLHNAGASFIISVMGSFTATFALVLPSFIIVLLIVKFYEQFMNNRIFEGVMSMLRPAVVGLIGSAAIILIVKTSWDGIPLLSKPEFEILKENFTDWKSWILLTGAVAASLFFKAGPILLIIIGGILGYILY
jgi:hypothetical protein